MTERGPNRTLTDAAFVGYGQAFRNYRHIAASPDLSALKDACAGQAAFLVGAGPSLDAQLDELRQAAGRGPIICEDAALRPLLRAGIRPEAVVCLDSSPWAWQRHLGRGRQCADILLLARFGVAPELLDGYPGPSLCVGTDDALEVWLGQVACAGGRIAQVRSFAHMAYCVARVLGCDPVVLVGLDFAFGPDGRQTARGVRRERSALDRLEGFGRGEVEALDGSRRETWSLWEVQRRWFEAAIAPAAERCIQTGGARMAGTRELPLAATIVELPPAAERPRLASLMPPARELPAGFHGCMRVELEQAAAALALACRNLSDIEDQLRQIDELALKAATLARPAGVFQGMLRVLNTVLGALEVQILRDPLIVQPALPLVAKFSQAMQAAHKPNQMADLLPLARTARAFVADVRPLAQRMHALLAQVAQEISVEAKLGAA